MEGIVPANVYFFELIPIIVIYIIQVITIKSNITNEVKTNDMLLAKIGDTTIDVWFRDKITKSEDIVKSEECIKVNKNETDRKLKQLGRSDRNVVAFGYSDGKWSLFVNKVNNISVSNRVISKKLNGRKTRSFSIVKV